MNDVSGSKQEKLFRFRDVWPHVLFAAATCISYDLIKSNSGWPNTAYGWFMVIAGALGAFVVLYVIGYLLALIFTRENRGRRALVIGSCIVWLLTLTQITDRDRKTYAKEYAEEKMLDRNVDGTFLDPKNFIKSNGYDSIGQNPKNTISTKRIYRKYVSLGPSDYERYRTIAKSYDDKKNINQNLCNSLLDLNHEFLSQRFGPYSSYEVVDYGMRGMVTMCKFSMPISDGSTEFTMFASGDDEGTYHVFLQRVNNESEASANSEPVVSEKGKSAPTQVEIPGFTPRNYIKSHTDGVSVSKLPEPDSHVTMYAASIPRTRKEIDSMFGSILNEYQKDPVAEITCNGMRKNLELKYSQDFGAPASITLVGSGYKDGYQSCAFIASAQGIENRLVYNYQSVEEEESIYFVVYAEAQ